MMYSVAFPEPASLDLLETLQEIQELACRDRSITDISGDQITLHFTTAQDAMSFLDLFFYLHEQMSQDEDAAELDDIASNSERRLKAEQELSGGK